jgi:two-component system response regulator GlrR
LEKTHYYIEISNNSEKEGADTLENLLIVTHDASLGTVLSQGFTIEGYLVDHTCKDDDALKMIEENSYDLMIVDDEHLSISGFKIVEEVNRMKPDLRKVLFCTHGNHRIREEAEKSGIDRFLDSPFDIKQVLQTVKKILVEGQND